MELSEPSAPRSPTASDDAEVLESASASPDPAESESAASEPTETEPVDVGDDWSLQIPAIDVQAPVVDLDMSANRVLVPPRDPSLVGWWSDGAAPGDPEGSAVIVGHSVSSGGGAFDDIDELDSGDRIEVEHLTYRVQSVEVMSKPDLARRAEELFDQSVPGGRLVVVTCEGYDGETWQSNAVAIAIPA